MKNVDRLIFCVLCMAPLCGFSQQSDNPFFTEWTTQFGAPPFEKIMNRHYLPAFIEGMKQHKVEIKMIINNKDAADFNNTILALDQTGTLLRKVGPVFYSLNSANTNDSMQKWRKSIVFTRFCCANISNGGM